MISTKSLRPAAVIAAAGAMTASLLALAAPASASTLTCGATITASVTLTANLNCSSDTTGNALNIGAAGVTINLGGHSILGPGVSNGTQTAGILDSGYSGLTVTGPGTISNFYNGVGVTGSSGSDLTGVRVTDLTAASTAPPGTNNLGAYAVDLAYVSGASVSGLTINDEATGVFLADSLDSVVTGNHLTAPADGGVDYGGDGDTWSHNTITSPSSIGLLVQAQSTADLVQANTVTGALAGYGIGVEQSTGTKVMSNTVSSDAVALYDYDGTNNTFNYDKGTGDGVGLYSQNDGQDGVTGGNYAHDTFSGGQYGMYIQDPANVTLTSDTLNHNSEAGAYVFNDGAGPGSVAAALSRTTGDDNRYGLYSTFATTGSGNIATGNTNVNCYNVTCTSSGRPAAGHAVAPPRLRLRMPAAPGPAWLARH